MCGIGLVVSGVEISSASSAGPSEVFNPNAGPSVLDLAAALRRRGPDSCGLHSVYLGEVQKLKENAMSSSSCAKLCEVVAGFGGESSSAGDSDLVCCISNAGHDYSVCCSRKWTQSTNDGAFSMQNGAALTPADVPDTKIAASLQFVGTTLQLRGSHPVCQPLQDRYGNILVYNGEVFGGLEVRSDENDTEVIFSKLQQCCSCSSPSCCRHKDQLTVPQLMSQIRGPWAFIFWQAEAQIIWFGRDVFGRRSLLVHWPTSDDPRLLLSSVAPAKDGVYDPFQYWEELPCGIHSIHIKKSIPLAWKGVTSTHEWHHPVLTKLVAWDRSSTLDDAPHNTAGMALAALEEAIKRRLINNRVKQVGEIDQQAPVAVLFSGGIDSMILAALVDKCLDIAYAIDLLNVSFEGPAAPDRISAVAGIEELRTLSPARCWRLIEVDETLGTWSGKILPLICPSQTYMDSNIGTALWAAARGDGFVRSAELSAKFKSEARVVLVGAGADEQCGGYLRYRTKFKLGGWDALAAEMRLDMQRLWKRNLGRDDRCIADHGKEARFPFLDENVIETFLDMPLSEVADLREDLGIGDKKILRQVARLLGLTQCVALPKRAIQFGSGIAKISNRKEFGSNRAANKASAGSVKLRVLLRRRVCALCEQELQGRICWFELWELVGLWQAAMGWS